MRLLIVPRLQTARSSRREEAPISLRNEIRASSQACCPSPSKVGRVTPCAPFARDSQNIGTFRRSSGAHGVTRPTFAAFDDLGNTPSRRLLRILKPLPAKRLVIALLSFGAVLCRGVEQINVDVCV